MRLALALALLALVLPPVAGAQGLGGAAARERQKRRQQGAAGAPVFSNHDLSTGQKNGTDGAGAGAEAAAAEPGAEIANPEAASAAAKPDAGAEAEPSVTEPPERERHERTLLQAEWRLRFANAREQLARAEAASWRDLVRTEFQAGVPVPMRIKEQIETPELKQARQALVDLEETYRKTGLPPGWVRQP